MKLRFPLRKEKNPNLKKNNVQCAILLTQQYNHSIVKTGIVKAQTLTTGEAPNSNVLIIETPTQKDREREALLHGGL